MSFRFLTAGESHGDSLIGIIEGLPAGVPISLETIHNELKLRQLGVGRSGRMKIEADSPEILSGIIHNKTIGSPITLRIRNKDVHDFGSLPSLEYPRPGHADLVGTLKFQHENIRLTLERASARETAMRTAIGALCQIFLSHFDIKFMSHVVQIGSVQLNKIPKEVWKQLKKIHKSPLFCCDTQIEKLMLSEIKTCQKKGESVGGIFEIRAAGLPLGLGSFIQWDLRLDSRIAGAIMSIPAIKGIEIGAGFSSPHIMGSKFQDQIFYDPKNHKRFGFYRKTNHCGGLEGGMTTGEDLILRAVMKPLSTLPKHHLNSVNIFTKKNGPPLVQRTDCCAVPAASIVGRNVVAIEIAKAFLEKFGGDSLKEIENNYHQYLKMKLS